MRESLYSDGAKQGTQAPSPAPRLIPAETEHQLRTNIAIGTANGGHFMPVILFRAVLGIRGPCLLRGPRESTSCAYGPPWPRLQ
jgi:hypothetical protein